VLAYGLFTLARFVCKNTCDIMTRYCPHCLLWQLGSFLSLSLHPRWPRQVQVCCCHVSLSQALSRYLRQCKHSFIHAFDKQGRLLKYKTYGISYLSVIHASSALFSQTRNIQIFFWNRTLLQSAARHLTLMGPKFKFR